MTPLQDLITAPIPGHLLAAAAELRIADALADGPRTAAELAGDTRTHEPALRRLLLALTGLGVLAQVERDGFALTDLGRPLATGAPDSVHALVELLCGPEMLRAWAELAESVRTGACGWELAHGMPVFEYYATHPDSAATFNAAMAQHTRDAAPGIIGAADFSRFGEVVDVGGGDGTLLAEILRAEPEARGVLFDLPEVLDGAPAPADRARAVAGDFFSAVPEGGDAYVLKQVLHDWPDEAAVAILRSCRIAMPPAARLLIVERMLPELVTPADVQPLMVDLLMLAASGGRERTEREFADLLAAAGLTPVSVSDALPPFDYRVIEARRAA